MKHIHLILVVTLGLSSHVMANGLFGEAQTNLEAGTVTCSDSGIPAETSLDGLSAEVTKTKCEIVNEQNTCSSKKSIDLDKRKIFLDSLVALDGAYQSSNGNLNIRKANPLPADQNPERKHNMETDIEAQIPGAFNALKYTGEIQPSSQAPYQPVLRTYNDYRTFRSGQSLKVMSNYHQYLKRSGNDKDFEKYQEEFADDYMAFEAEKECQRGVSVGLSPSIASLPAQMEKDAGFSKCEENESVFRQKYARSKDTIEQYFKDEYGGANGLTRGQSCDSKVEIRRMTVVAHETPSCAGRFEQLFSDNEWDMNTSALSSDPEYTKFKECVEKMQADGLKLNNVAISASSSQLNNTGRAGQQFCAKGFLELSTARAESARNLMVSNFAFPSESFSAPHVRGSNGNGSSGECPYEEINGREVLKSEYRNGGAARAELDDAKFVRVTVSFEPKVTPVNNRKSCYQAQIYCTRLNFRCNEWSKDSKDTSWGIRQAYKRKREAQAAGQ
tara:strand:+ start:701 stop:2203 length:1503 start_codon:yes stop_codon:yes gene_type:complete